MSTLHGSWKELGSASSLQLNAADLCLCNVTKVTERTVTALTKIAILDMTIAILDMIGQAQFKFWTWAQSLSRMLQVGIPDGINCNIHPAKLLSIEIPQNITTWCISLTKDYIVRLSMRGRQISSWFLFYLNWTPEETQSLWILFILSSAINYKSEDKLQQ